MSRRWRWLGALALVALAVAGVLLRPLPTPSGPVADTGEPPPIVPALAGVVLPPNIAAPGLRLTGECRGWRITLSGGHGSLTAGSRGRDLRLSPRRWRRLLEAHRGEALTIEVMVDRGGWRRYTATCSVAREPIDRYLTYRLLTPVYNLVRDVGIYQRDLTDYDERLIMHGRQVGGCVNCHTFSQGSGELFTLGVRSDGWGGRTLLVEGGRVTPLKQPVGYGSWHPSGRLAMFSANQVRQFFHAAGPETRDVFDLSSGLALFDVCKRTFSSTPALSSPDYLYTYPCWSPDGTALYFSRARRTWPAGELIPPPGYDQVRYDLCRIAFDDEQRTWGRLETLRSGQQLGRSLVFPRVSPDGRWLLYTSCDYGCFPIHRPNSDLGQIDLRSGADVAVAVNSPRADTWHSFSRNSRWVVFASKRADGLFTKLYLSYLDADGRLQPPLLLPQRRADYYDTFWYSYNTPELTTSRIRVSVGQMGRAARSADAQAAPLPPEVAPPVPSAR